MPPRQRRVAPRGEPAEIVAVSDEEDGEMLDEIVSAGAAVDAPPPASDALISFGPSPLDALEDEGLEEYFHRVTFHIEDLSMIYKALHAQQQMWMPGSQRELMATRFRSLDLVSRVDEENHLREPLPGSLERPCIRGDQCEAMQIPGVVDPRPLVQHHTLSQRAEHQTQHKPLPDSMCIMCKRYVVLYFYANTQAEAQHPDRPGAGNEMAIFHSHANYEGIPGEYILEQCVANGEEHSHGMIAPCAIQCWAWFQWERGSDGVLRFSQDGGYLKPSSSDF